MQSTPFLLLHGALGAKDQLTTLANELASSGPVHTLSFSGHGGNPLPSDPFSPTLFASDVLQFLDDQQIDRVHVFGHSMGGFVGVYLAANHPDRIQSVSTLGTKWSWSPEIAAKEIKMLNPDKIEEKVPTYASLLDKRHAPTNWKELVHRTADMMNLLGNGAALGQEEFERISCPVNIGVGALDKMVSVEESRQTVGAIKKGSLQIFEDFPHPIEKIHIGRLVAHLLAFVNETTKT